MFAKLGKCKHLPLFCYKTKDKKKGNTGCCNTKGLYDGAVAIRSLRAAGEVNDDPFVQMQVPIIRFTMLASPA
jgi:hypothetical protein